MEGGGEVAYHVADELVLVSEVGLGSNEHIVICDRACIELTAVVDEEELIELIVVVH